MRIPDLEIVLFAFALTASAAHADAPAVALPALVGQTRGGIPVVALQGSAWAVVALHARLAEGELTPLERLQLEAAASALADGNVGKPRAISADVSDAGGRSRAAVRADSLVAAQGGPPEHLDVLLRTVDGILRERAHLVAAGRALERAPVDEAALDPRALALAAPGSPLASSTKGAADPAALKSALEKILKKDRVVLSVVGPLPAPELLALVQKLVVTPLPASSGTPGILPVTLAEGTRLAEGVDDNAAGAASTVWLVAPGRGTAGASPKDRAARALLARLAGGRVEATDALFAVAVDVKSARTSQIARAEASVLTALEAVAATAPPAELVDNARIQERAARLARLKDADLVADAAGEALLAGDVGIVDKELAALNDVTPADVSAAAKAALSGPRVIVRALGGRK